MYKIKSIKFKNHPILGNLYLDFCGLDGKAVDTVIIAGENGTGKSTVIDSLYQALCFKTANEIFLLVDKDGDEISFDYYFDKNTSMVKVKDNNNLDTYQNLGILQNKYKFHSIYSDVDINFKGSDVHHVKSTELDSVITNQRSDPNLPTSIKQLIVDIQSSDDADTAASVRKVGANSRSFDDIKIGTRISRFTKAFNRMFSDLSYSRVKNINNKKSIIFEKNGKQIEIDALSSGEKQIVYRGCFLLRDMNSMNGAFVFVDEPEISLHPSWQKKILDFYKGIFTNSERIQTSQLFVVTHSPFIIHNNERKNDKVIVLQRDEHGLISAIDKPEYYLCNSVAPIRDAFNVNDFSADTKKSVVYLEGRTDELYFKKAVEVLGYDVLPFEFQWVGHLKNNGQEEFTGASNLNYAVNFMRGRNPEKPQVFLYDCDTNKEESFCDNIIIMRMPKYESKWNMNKGVENALILDDINLEDFYVMKKIKNDYVPECMIPQFEKMGFCKYICGLDNIELQKKIFSNLSEVIDKISERVNKILSDTHSG